MHAANAKNQSVDHRSSVLLAAPQYGQYLSVISNCPTTGNNLLNSFPEDPVSISQPVYISIRSISINSSSTGCAMLSVEKTVLSLTRALMCPRSLLPSSLTLQACCQRLPWRRRVSLLPTITCLPTFHAALCAHRASFPNLWSCLQQTGRFLVQGPQYAAQNLTTTSPNASYGFYSYLDLATGDGMLLVNGTCNENTNNTQYTAELNKCAAQHGSTCCLDMTQYSVTLALCLRALFQLACHSHKVHSSNCCPK